MRQPGTLVGLFSQLSGAGGVQRAGRHIAAVAARFVSARKLECRFLSLNDPEGTHRVEVDGREFFFRGFARRKQAFLWSTLRLWLARPRLILVGHPHLAPVASLMKPVAKRPRIAVFAHGIEVSQRLSPLRRRSLDAADMVVAPSSHTRSLLVSIQGVALEKTTVLPWGLDPQFWDSGKAAARLPPEFPPENVILAVARLDAREQYKGVDTLIESLPALASAVPEVHLVVVGDGDDRARLEAIARDRGVAGRVCFLGTLAGETLRACYEQCTVFAMPSGGEGFGLVFLEAMACGKPVVGGAHGGTPDVVEEGATGFLVRHGDRDRLAEVLRLLLTDGSLRARMGQQARQRVLDHFRFEFFEAGLVRLLEEACAS